MYFGCKVRSLGDLRGYLYPRKSRANPVPSETSLSGRQYLRRNGTARLRLVASVRFAVLILLLGGLLAAMFEEFAGLVGAFPGERAGLFALEFVVVGEELGDFGAGLFGKVVDGAEGAVEVSGFGDGEEAVVAIGLSVLCLFDLHDAEEADKEGAAGKAGLVHEDEDVEGIAVAANRLRKETEVVREDHAGGKSGFKDEDALFFIKAVLVAAAARCFDDDLQQIVARLGGTGAAVCSFLL